MKNYCHKFYQLPLMFLFLVSTLDGQIAFSIGMNSDILEADNAIDNQGNVFIYGTFNETIDIDPSTNIVELTSNSGLNNDIFISSYNEHGELRFGFNLGWEGDYANERAKNISLDSYGNIYITGTFNGVVDFDPSSNTVELVSADPIQGNSFIASYTNTGDFRFAFNLNINGFIPTIDNLDIEIDQSGNLYVSGVFSGTVDFDPSNEVNELSIGNSDVSSFLASYNNNGEFRFVFDLGYVDLSSPAFDLAVTDNGSCYLTGRFGGSVDFDPGVDTFELSTINTDNNINIFVASYSSEGVFQSAFSLNLGNYFAGSPFHSFAEIELDQNENIYLTGSMSGTAYFDPSNLDYEITNISSGLFLASYTDNGEFRFAFSLGTEETLFDTIKTVVPTDLALDEFGNIYVTGVFDGTIDFDPSLEEFKLLNNNNGLLDNDSDIFLASYSNTGEFRFAERFGAITGDDGLLFPNVSVNENGISCISGNISGILEFNENSNSYEVVDEPSGSSMLVACFNSEGVLVSSNEIKESKCFNIFPNPASGILNIELNNTTASEYIINIYDLKGKLLYHKTQLESFSEVDCSSLQNGYYLINISDNLGNKISHPLIIVGNQ